MGKKNPIWVGEKRPIKKPVFNSGSTIRPQNLLFYFLLAISSFNPWNREKEQLGEVKQNCSLSFYQIFL
jgi:hypothetical protein